MALSIDEIRRWHVEHPDEALNLRGANLSGANLSGAYLRGTDLRGANLHGANLSGANLSGADLSGAYLSGANLSGANLRGADLSGAYLSGANLSGAYLRGAYLHGADLSGAYLRGTDLHGANLPHFQIPSGELIVWGKKAGVLVEMLIPREAKRTGSLVGRKCRAEYARVVSVMSDAKTTTVINYYGETSYTEGSTVYPDSYDDDPRVECTHGIHFFLTRAEAEEW